MHARTSREIIIVGFFLPFLILVLLFSSCAPASESIRPHTMPVVPSLAITITASLSFHPAETLTPIPTSISNQTLDIEDVITQDSNPFWRRAYFECLPDKLSPSGSWLAARCPDDEYRIVNFAHPVQWVFSFSKYADGFFEGLDGGISQAAWTVDEKVLFLYIVVNDNICPPKFANGSGFIRLDLATGKITEVLNHTRVPSYSLAVSDDANFLAYISESTQPMILHIIDLENDGMFDYPIPAKYNTSGSFLWSPSKEWIVFEQAYIDCVDLKQNQYSVAAINLFDGTRQTIIPDQALQMSPEAWLNDHTLQLVGVVDGQFQSWEYDFRDHTLHRR